MMAVFLEVSIVFVFEKAYPSVRWLFFWEFRKNSLTMECFTSGISSCRDEVQPSVGMASPSRNFSTSRSSAFRFPFLFSSWIFPHLDLSAAAYPNRIGCTSWFFKMKKKEENTSHPIKTSLAYSCPSFESRNIEKISMTLVKTYLLHFTPLKINSVKFLHVQHFSHLSASALLDFSPFFFSLARMISASALHRLHCVRPPLCMFAIFAANMSTYPGGHAWCHMFF